MRLLAQLAVGALCATCICGSAANVTDVSVRTVSPWTNLVEIAWSLDVPLAPTAPNGRLVQTVTVRDADTGASLTLTNNLAETALFPRTPSYSAGPHRLLWKPAEKGFCPARATVEVRIRETTTPQTYCVVDLSGGASATSYHVDYRDDVPAGGWTDAYKTDKLVLRLIEPGMFAMGDQVHGGASVSGIALTQAYYIGVFETTEGQWNRVTGTAGVAGSTYPVSGVAWGVGLRGTLAGNKWPSDPGLDTWSSLYKFRRKTGIAFDLPTEAQWEYACRAGTTTDYGNGTNWEGTGGESVQMAAVGCYRSNRPSNRTTWPVGRFAPNAWGLYDMHGNVQEWCLDWYGPSLTADSADPAGPNAGDPVNNRVVRGGYWDSTAANCTSAARDHQDLKTANDKTGFRLVCPAPVASEVEVCAGMSAPTALERVTDAVLSVGEDPVPIDYDPLYAGVDPDDGPYTVRVTLDGGTNLVEATGAGRLEDWTAHWYTNVLRHVVLRDGQEVGTPLERVLVSTLGPDALTLGECVNAPQLTFTAGGTGGWSRDTVTNLDGVVSLRSRDTGDDGCTWLETKVVGGGTLTFWWKVSSEGSKKTLYDYMTFSVDDREVRQFGWEVDWTEVSIEVEGEGEHVLRWAYEKDDQDAEGDDCGWLDLVSWSGAVPGPEREETETTPVPVPYVWLDRYPSILETAGGDYEAAANAPTGKRDAAGEPMHVWQDFVAGTDPTKPDDVLRVSIDMQDGQPSVTWSPDLGDARRYQLLGAATLTGSWTKREGNVPDPADRFFKVSVSLPE